MASQQGPHFLPSRTDNILADEQRTVHTSSSTAQTYTGSFEEGRPRNGGHRDSSVERPELTSCHSSTDIEDGHYLKRVQTSQSVRDRRQYEPILVGDWEDLRRAASNMDNDLKLVRTKTQNSTALEHKDTLAGIEIGDPCLDPKSPEFDIYKWSRM